MSLHESPNLSIGFIDGRWTGWWIDEFSNCKRYIWFDNRLAAESWLAEFNESTRLAALHFERKPNVIN